MDYLIKYFKNDPQRPSVVRLEVITHKELMALIQKREAQNKEERELFFVYEIGDCILNLS